ncbi:MAG TPA: hypothetical protein VK390_01150, partial [Propionibacteriaceae bacterium]|nr:hypothetical protein [Propionibacteriaceae bacterium]
PAPAQPTPPPGVATKPTDAFAEDRWTASNIVEARDATAGLANVLSDGRLVLPADAVLWDVDFLADEEIVKPVYLRLEGVDGTEATVKYGERGWDLSGNRARLDELSSVRITTSGVTGTGKTGFVSCIFAFRSRSFRIVFPVRLVADQSLLVLSAATVTHELSTHLMQSRLYYSRAVWNSIDDATLGILLSRFTVLVKNRETPLVELVDPTPVGLVGNLLGFRAPGLGEETDLDKAYRRGAREDHIPVPSGGVFAEAVLGRFNSAERLDITRFWDWADSPIPVQAPDIAPLAAGSRGTDDDLRPGQLSSPVLNIVNPPGLPDPTGMAGVLAAIQNGMMFRDMSGLAGTIGLAQAGVAAAQQGAQHAAEQAGLNAAVAAELGGKVAEIVGKLIAAWTTGGASAAAGGAADAGSGGGIINAAKGMSKSGSLLNYARDMDARGVEHPSVEASGAEGSGGGSSAGEGQPRASSATGAWEGDAAGASLGLGGSGPTGAMGTFARWVKEAATGGVPDPVTTLLETAKKWKIPLTTRAAAEAIWKEIGIFDALTLADEKVPDAKKLAILREATKSAIAATKNPDIKKELQNVMVAANKLAVLAVATKRNLSLNEAVEDAIAKGMSLEQANKLGDEKVSDAEKLKILRAITQSAIAKTTDPKLKKELQDLVTAIDKTTVSP